MATMECLLLYGSILVTALWAVRQGSSAPVKDRPPTIFLFRTMGMIWIIIMVLIVEPTIWLMIRFFWLPTFRPNSLDLFFCTAFVREWIRTLMPWDRTDLWLWARRLLWSHGLLIYLIESSFMIVVMIGLMVVGMWYTMLVCSLMLIIESFFSINRGNRIECLTSIRLWNFAILLYQGIFGMGVTPNKVVFIKRIVVMWCCSHACNSGHH